MLNINLHDKSFRPDASTVRGRSPKYWRYMTSNAIEHTAFTVRTHGEIFQGFQGHPRERQFGMAWESAAIVPDLYQALSLHAPMLAQHYKHIFTYHPDLLKQDPELFKYAPSYGHWMDTEYGGSSVDEGGKNRTCALVISAKNMAPGHALRAWCGQRYRSQHIDLFGDGVGRPFAKSSEVLSPYLFHLAIENNVMDNYITEKVLNCFATKTVPIYWGAANIGNWFNPDGIIRFEDFVEGMKNVSTIDEYLTSPLYRSMVNAIEDNYERVKAWGRPIEDYIHEEYFGSAKKDTK